VFDDLRQPFMLPVRKLRRNTSTPASTSSRNCSRVAQAGPTVAMILVFTSGFSV
jgi:hypothetical protein